MVNIVLNFLKKLESDPSTPYEVERTLDEIEKLVAFLTLYGVNMQKKIEERSRQRQGLGQKPGG